MFRWISNLTICSRAKTGSGKTLAFLLPMIERLYEKQKDHRHPRMLILEPTRELAVQVLRVIEEMRLPSMKAAVVYGGANIMSQGERVRGCDILVATPGRLTDFLRRGWVSLEK